MTKKKKEDNEEKEKPEVHPDLEGFDIEINEFGQILGNYNMDKINDFLDKNVDDKKLKDRDFTRKTDDELPEENTSDEQTD